MKGSDRRDGTEDTVPTLATLSQPELGLSGILPVRDLHPWSKAPTTAI